MGLQRGLAGCSGRLIVVFKGPIAHLLVLLSVIFRRPNRASCHSLQHLKFCRAYQSCENETTLREIVPLSRRTQFSAAIIHRRRCGSLTVSSPVSEDNLRYSSLMNNLPLEASKHYCFEQRLRLNRP